MKNFETFQPDRTESSFLSRPFDPLRIKLLEEESAANQESGDERIIYQEKIDEDMTYSVSAERPYIAFRITDQEGGDLMFFRFRLVDGHLSLEHREVDKEAGQRGLTGSQFLKKNEDFLKILLEKGGHHEVEDFLIDSGQVGIIKWAQKNGYRFQDPEQEKRFDRIAAGQDKDYLVTDRFRSGNRYFKYIFQKEKATEARAFLNEQLRDGYEREDVDLRPFTERFQLFKEIKK